MNTAASPSPSASASEAEQDDSRLARLRRRHPWVDHLLCAVGRYQDRHGDHYAAAITYFSVLALVPILMVAFAAAGFVLFNDAELLGRLEDSIAGALPGGLGELVGTTIDRAVEQRQVVGALGLLTALYSGLGWMANLRAAITAQWNDTRQAPALHRRLLGDLVSLAGLGLALLLSFGLTALGGGFAHGVLDLLGVERSPLATVLLIVVGSVLALTANGLVFLWVLVRLPRRTVSVRGAWKAALLAAIGFELLKRVGAFYLTLIGDSPAGVAFGSVIGLLVFVNLVSRFLLLVTAWTATAPENRDRRPTSPPAPAVISPAVTVHAGPGPRSAAMLVGAGAVTAMVTTRLLRGRCAPTRSRPRR
ncbi:membrane protein [Actinoalloteichus hoggarensis]|uniref:Inner membrane protein YhjD n=1 Tax=Actinoalloteichus hoggarensis TaxID=1470176 RepID=A0A221WAG4_9PSEU|nr:inner membrane protein YhjD [Actinoalloteichus hoggarensis]ASO22681.1 Inner membrane protein YhjD [Actinoalloteichus hoggarensis]MBB5924176.1 membrane protein [Actinoalloteichus hoggarensis]